MSLDHIIQYFKETARIAARIDYQQVEYIVGQLVALRDRNGRLFIAGLGGSAANASHAANDFRKLAHIDAIALNDATAELTARANDEGWDTIYSGMLRASNAGPQDALLVLSVGGGTETVSTPLVRAMEFARAKSITSFGIVGRDGGYAAKFCNACVIVPPISADRVTPHTEAFQSVILHCMVSHPDLQINSTKW